MKSSNKQRVNEEIKRHCTRIIELPHFINLLESDYKQLVHGWNKLHKVAHNVFIEVCCEIHASKLLQTVQKRRFDGVSLLAFEKEVRGIMSHMRTCPLQ